MCKFSMSIIVQILSILYVQILSEYHCENPQCTLCAKSQLYFMCKFSVILYVQILSVLYGLYVQSLSEYHCANPQCTLCANSQ
jgi:hypothetical protein